MIPGPDFDPSLPEKRVVRYMYQVFFPFSLRRADGRSVVRFMGVTCIYATRDWRSHTVPRSPSSLYSSSSSSSFGPSKGQGGGGKDRPRKVLLISLGHGRKADLRKAVLQRERNLEAKVRI